MQSQEAAERMMAARQAWHEEMDKSVVFNNSVVPSAEQAVARKTVEKGLETIEQEFKTMTGAVGVETAVRITAAFLNTIISPELPIKMEVVSTESQPSSQQPETPSGTQ